MCKVILILGKSPWNMKGGSNWPPPTPLEKATFIKPSLIRVRVKSFNISWSNLISEVFYNSYQLSISLWWSKPEKKYGSSKFSYLIFSKPFLFFSKLLITYQISENSPILPEKTPPVQTETFLMPIFNLNQICQIVFSQNCYIFYILPLDWIEPLIEAWKF